MFLTSYGNMMVLGSIIYAIAYIVTYEGFLMVLYSRLHLIVDSPRLLRALLFAIVGLGIPLQIVMTLAGDRVLSTKVWNVTFRVEMIFPFSEIALSTLYVFLFIRFMCQSTGSGNMNIRRTLYLLVGAEIVVLVTDVIGITLWYMGLYLLRLALLPFLYSIKLKVEFMILNRLTGIGKRKSELRNITLSVHEVGGEMEVTSPSTFLSATPTLTMDTGLGIELGFNEDDTRGKTTPTNSIDEITANVEGSGSPEERESFDEMERRYLGRMA
jgi:hypothetical protein